MGEVKFIAQNLVNNIVHIHFIYNEIYALESGLSRMKKNEEARRKFYHCRIDKQWICYE